MKEHSAAEEKGILSAHLVKNRLKRSEPREAILDVFLRSDHHVSVDELLRLVQKRRRDIGRTTVYRALKVFQQAGLAHELVLDGENRYERAYKRGHHDHFICNGCGSILEFTSPEIEVIQERHANRIGFKIEGHRHQVYGQCQSCVGKGARRTRR